MPSSTSSSSPYTYTSHSSPNLSDSSSTLSNSINDPIDILNLENPNSPSSDSPSHELNLPKYSTFSSKIPQNNEFTPNFDHLDNLSPSTLNTSTSTSLTNIVTTNDKKTSVPTAILTVPKFNWSFLNSTSLRSPLFFGQSKAANSNRTSTHTNTSSTRPNRLNSILNCPHSSIQSGFTNQLTNFATNQNMKTRLVHTPCLTSLVTSSNCSTDESFSSSVLKAGVYSWRKTFTGNSKTYSLQDTTVPARLNSLTDTVTTSPTTGHNFQTTGSRGFSSPVTFESALKYIGQSRDDSVFLELPVSSLNVSRPRDVKINQNNDEECLRLAVQLLNRFQEAYRRQHQENELLRTEISTLNDELQEAETRIRHYKVLLQKVSSNQSISLDGGGNNRDVDANESQTNLRAVSMSKEMSQSRCASVIIGVDGFEAPNTSLTKCNDLGTEQKVMLAGVGGEGSHGNGTVSSNGSVSLNDSPDSEVESMSNISVYSRWARSRSTSITTFSTQSDCHDSISNLPPPTGNSTRYSVIISDDCDCRTNYTANPRTKGIVAIRTDGGNNSCRGFCGCCDSAKFCLSDPKQPSYYWLLDKRVRELECAVDDCLKVIS